MGTAIRVREQGPTRRKSLARFLCCLSPFLPHVITFSAIRAVSLALGKVVLICSLSVHFVLASHTAQDVREHKLFDEGGNEIAQHEHAMTCWPAQFPKRYFMRHHDG